MKYLRRFEGKLKRDGIRKTMFREEVKVVEEEEQGREHHIGEIANDRRIELKRSRKWHKRGNNVENW